jgi:protein TonB
LRQPSPVPSFVERLRTGAGRRTLALTLAVLIEALLLLMLYSLNTEERPGDKEGRTIVTFQADEVAEPEPEPKPDRREQRPAPRRPVPEQPQPPQPPQPAQPSPLPPTPVPTPQPLPPPPVVLNPARPTAPLRVYGPPDTGRRPSAFADSEVVGTAPNGEPLYKADWYRRPTEKEMAAYLSTARAPSRGLIACRTAPNWRVEDCVGVGESPPGSQIVRAMLAAAWELKVRPARLGGKSLVGSWVQIEFEYDIVRRGRDTKD